MPSNTSETVAFNGQLKQSQDAAPFMHRPFDKGNRPWIVSVEAALATSLETIMTD